MTYFRFIFALIFMLTACQGKGIEVGNPVPLLNKQVLIVPTSGEVDYRATFISETNVSVAMQSKITPASLKALSDNAVPPPVRTATLESVTVNYSQSGSTVTFEASFGDGTQIQVTLTVDDEGNVLSGAITVNGEFLNSNITSADIDGDLAAGLAALEVRHLQNANNAFCGGFPSGISDSSMAFGCFLVKLMLLPEGNEATQLLAAFDQPAFDVDSKLLGANGLFANRHLIEIGGPIDGSGGHKFPAFNYLSFDLPFANLFRAIDSRTFTQKIAALMNIAIGNGLKAADIQERLFDLSDRLKELEILMAIVIADENFSFTIPAGLYRLDQDVPVTTADALLFMGTVQSSIVSADFINAYDFGVDFADVVRTGDIDQQVLVADLNGAGGVVGGRALDTVSFLTLNDAALITNNRSRVLSAMQRLKSGLAQINGGVESRFTTRLETDYNLTSAVQSLSEFIAAMKGPVQTGFGRHVVQINLDALFDNPPDAASLDVTAGDPFVLEEGRATPVPTYFREFFDGIIE